MTERTFPEITDPRYTTDGRIDCIIDHPDHGLIPTTLDPAEDQELFDHVAAEYQIASYAPASHADQRTAALAEVDAIHSDLLLQLTGNATVEERNTWVFKKDAAVAYIASTATPGQVALIELEAGGDGVDPLVLAQDILDQSEGFLTAVGVANAIKSRAKTDIRAATEETVPLADVGPAVEARLAALVVEVNQTIAQSGV